MVQSSIFQHLCSLWKSVHFTKLGTRCRVILLARKIAISTTLSLLAIELIGTTTLKSRVHRPRTYQIEPGVS
jgi:hypothetical protein